MASTAALELLIKLKDDASKGMDKLAERGGKLEGVFGGLKRGATLAGGGVLALGAAFGVAVKKAADEETGIARLNQTLKNSIPNWNGNTDAVDAYIKKQQKLAFADDELRDSLNDLVIQTGDLKKAQELQTTAMDLARAKGMDLQTATKLVGKVNAENIGILKRYGIAIDDNATSEEALTAIRKAAGGQAQTYARTTEGALKRIKNAFADMVEDVGGVGLPAVGEALNKLADFMEGEKFQGLIKKVLESVVEGFKTLGTWAGNARRAIEDFTAPLRAAADRLSDIGGILKNSVLPGLKDVFDGNFDRAAERLKEGFHGIWLAIKDALPDLKAFGSNIAAAIGKVDFTAAGSAIMTGLINAFIFTQQHKAEIVGKLKELFSGAFGALKSELPGALDQHAPEIGSGIASLFTKAITHSNIAGLAVGIIAPGLIEKAPEMIEAAWKWVEGAVKAAPTVLPALLAAVRTFISDVGIPGLKAAFTQWVEPAWEWAKDVAGKAAEKLWPIIADIAAWITNTGIPAVRDAAAGLAGAIWKWVDDAAAAAPGKMEQYMAAIRTWALGAGNQTMQNIGTNLSAGFQQGISKLEPMIKVDVPRAISDGLAKIGQMVTYFFQTLKATIDGFTPDLSAATAKWTVDGAVGIAAGFLKMLETVIGGFPAIQAAVKGGAEGAAGNLLGGFFSTLQSFWDKWNLFWAQVKEILATKIWNMMMDAGKGVGDGLAKGILDGIKGAWNTIVTWVLNRIVELMRMVQRVVDNFGGGGGSNSGGGNGDTGGTGARARGGSVAARTPYLVGERGPEMFVPRNSGTIIPNHRLVAGAGMGAVNIRNVTINAGPGANGAQLAAEFIEEIEYQIANRAYTRNPSLARAG